MASCSKFQLSALNGRCQSFSERVNSAEISVVAKNKLHIDPDISNENLPLWMKKYFMKFVWENKYHGFINDRDMRHLSLLVIASFVLVAIFTNFQQLNIARLLSKEPRTAI